MKYLKTALTFVLLALLLAACGANETPDAPQLTVVGGQAEKVYTAGDLRALPAATVEVEGVIYNGVRLADLLVDAGVSTGAIGDVTAVAADNFSATYEPDLALLPTTLVAYGAGDGDLPADEQPFRMVLPDQPGRLNVRMLVRIQANP